VKYSIHNSGAVCIIACFFLLVFGLLSGVFADETSRILLINSNASVGKYREVQDAFRESVGFQVREVDLGNDGTTGIRALSDYKPDMLYCIGAKAYTFGRENFREKPVVFSSIINWQRMKDISAGYGVSNELPARMPIFMFRSVFPSLKKIGILYSREYTLEWFQETSAQAEELGISIVGKMISSRRQIVPVLEDLTGQTDALWLIPDPQVMSEKKDIYEIFRICDRKKLPVLAYHSLFIEMGAVLSVAVDNPTIGRQVAGIAETVLSGGKPDEKVQFPAGSSITLDLKRAKAYGLEYNRDSLGLVNRIIN